MPTVWQEIKALIAVTIAMGLLVLRDLNEYWSTSSVLSAPFFPSVMTRDRFWMLLSFFHLANNDALPQRGDILYSPLNKLGTVYKSIIHQFGNTCLPHQQLSIDEGMIPWRGHLRFNTYNPNKPKKYGMKAYMVCDAINGYVCKFKLYTGRQMTMASEGGI